MKKIAVLLLISLLLPSAEALLVVGDSGSGSIYTNGAGAGTGWDYVGNLIGTAPSSVSYVSNGWFLTANHVWTGDVVGRNENILNLGGTGYSINLGSYTSITNANGTSADLCMFRVNALAGLPAGMAVLESTPHWSSSLRLIGNGYDNGGITGMTWGNGTPYKAGSSTLTLLVGDTASYLSIYDSGIEGDAYAQTYDSGGGVFVDGQLAGVMFSIGTYGGEDVTVVTDFSVYGQQINQTSVIPEPTTAILLAGVALAFGIIKRFRYMYQ
ncbi:MAG: trypsin-like serine protease [Kiritimatiellales bacterium]